MTGGLGAGATNGAAGMGDGDGGTPRLSPGSRSNSRTPRPLQEGRPLVDGGLPGMGPNSNTHSNTHSNTPRGDGLTVAPVPRPRRDCPRPSCAGWG